MESHLGLMLEQRWDLKMDTLMVLIITSLIYYCFSVHWDILTLKCMDLMKSSNWDLLVVKFLAL